MKWAFWSIPEVCAVGVSGPALRERSSSQVCVCKVVPASAGQVSYWGNNVVFSPFLQETEQRARMVVSSGALDPCCW